MVLYIVHEEHPIMIVTSLDLFVLAYTYTCMAAIYRPHYYTPLVCVWIGLKPQPAGFRSPQGTQNHSTSCTYLATVGTSPQWGGHSKHGRAYRLLYPDIAPNLPHELFISR